MHEAHENVSPARRLLKADARSWATTSIADARSGIVRPKFQTFLFLEGRQSFLLDGEHFDIDAGSGASARPKALTFVLDRQSEVTLLRGSDRLLDKVSITSPPTWMDDMGIAPSARSRALSDFMSGHLNHLVWEPGAEVLKLAHQIRTPPRHMGAEMQALYRTARGFDLMALVCEAIGGPAAHAVSPLSPNQQKQMARVRDFIVGHLDDALCIGWIAKETGTSVRSLQRQFRDHYGVTVFDFIRNERLERARDALEGLGVSVAEAAHIAGYRNASSFSTIFKKHYGVPPRSWRA